jgi:hypothetical protein
MDKMVVVQAPTGLIRDLRCSPVPYGGETPVSAVRPIVLGREFVDSYPANTPALGALLSSEPGAQQVRSQCVGGPAHPATRRALVDPETHGPFRKSIRTPSPQRANVNAMQSRFVSCMTMGC